MLFQQLHIGDRHAPVYGFANVVDGDKAIYTAVRASTTYSTRNSSDCPDPACLAGQKLGEDALSVTRCIC